MLQLKMSKRGRKTIVDEYVVGEKFLMGKKELFLEDGQVCGKTHEIWETLLNDLNNTLSSRTLYSKMLKSEFLKL